jgi:hypothetical protein
MNYFATSLVRAGGHRLKKETLAIALKNQAINTCQKMKA